MKSILFFQVVPMQTDPLLLSRWVCFDQLLAIVFLLGLSELAPRYFFLRARLPSSVFDSRGILIFCYVYCHNFILITHIIKKCLAAATS